MSQHTKWEKEELLKEELLKILINVRSSLRCDLQRKLSLEKQELISDINKQIKELNEKKENILKEHNLLNIEGSRYGCDLIPLHPELKVLDEETNVSRKKILRGN